MANIHKRFGIPKFYTSGVHKEVQGDPSKTTSDIVKEFSNSITFLQGSLDRMFDNDPTTTTIIDAQSESAEKTFYIDTHISTHEYVDWDSILILGHNFETAGAEIRITCSDSASFAGANAVPITPRVNATTETNNEVSFASNGWSLLDIAIPESDGGSWYGNRYIRISFDSVNASFSDDIEIGAIIIGESFTAPVRPDLNVSVDIEHKNEIKESLNGSRFSTMFGQGYSKWINRYPRFINSSTYWTHFPSGRIGRTIFDISFSMIQDSDMFPDSYYWSDVQGQHPDNTEKKTFERNIINTTFGSHFPFVLQLDKDKYQADEDETANFYLVRMTNYSMTQTAPHLWQISMTLEEEI